MIWDLIRIDNINEVRGHQSVLVHCTLLRPTLTASQLRQEIIHAETTALHYVTVCCTLGSKKTVGMFITQLH